MSGLQAGGSGYECIESLSADMEVHWMLRYQGLCSYTLVGDAILRGLVQTQCPCSEAARPITMCYYRDAAFMDGLPDSLASAFVSESGTAGTCVVQRHILYLDVSTVLWPRSLID